MRFFNRRAGTKPASHSSGARRCKCRLRPASRVVVEALERRWLMTTFNAYFSIPAGTQQASTSGCCIIAQFTTTGGTAYKWDVDWNDSTAHSIFYPNGSQTVFYDHTYSDVSHPPYNITATAYPSSTGGGIQAVQALTNSFGTAGTGSHIGMTIASPSGGSGDLSGKSMVLDDLGRAYVATPYSGQIAVTRFTSAGAVDTSWGPNANGTWAIPSFDGGSDSPASLYFAAITINGNTTKYLAVAGKGANGFAVALFNLTDGRIAWSVPLTGNPALEGGQANAVYIDRNGDVIAVGKNGGKMVAVKLVGGYSNGALASWGDNNSGIVTVPHWSPPSGAYGLGESANAIIEFPSGAPADDLIVGGWTSYQYSYNGCCTTGCDWAMIVLGDSNGTKDSTNSFGCCNVNFAHFAEQPGQSINMCSSHAGFYSQDSINAFTIVLSGVLKILPVGSTNYTTTSTQVAVGCLQNDGTWDHRYGPDLEGLLVGSTGIGYAATLDPTSGTTVAGVTSGGTAVDFLVDSFTSGGQWNKGNPPFTPGFGNNGVFTTDFGDGSTNSTDGANGVAFTPDGTSVVVGGYTKPSGSSYGEIALAEYNTTNWLVIQQTLAPSPHAIQPTLNETAIDPTLLPLKRRPRQPPLLSG